jgi:hypothetical protein
MVCWCFFVCVSPLRWGLSSKTVSDDLFRQKALQKCLGRCTLGGRERYLLRRQVVRFGDLRLVQRVEKPHEGQGAASNSVDNLAEVYRACALVALTLLRRDLT